MIEFKMQFVNETGSSVLRIKEFAGDLYVSYRKDRGWSYLPFDIFVDFYKYTCLRNTVHKMGLNKIDSMTFEEALRYWLELERRCVRSSHIKLPGETVSGFKNMLYYLLSFYNLAPEHCTGCMFVTNG